MEQEFWNLISGGQDSDFWNDEMEAVSGPKVNPPVTLKEVIEITSYSFF